MASDLKCRISCEILKANLEAGGGKREANEGRYQCTKVATRSRIRREFSVSLIEQGENAYTLVGASKSVGSFGGPRF